MAINGFRVKPFLWYKKMKIFKNWEKMHFFILLVLEDKSE